MKLLVAVLLLAGTSRLSAQVVEGYAEPGDIVRFNLRSESDDGLRIGRLARLMSDSVILEKCFQCSPLRYSRSETSGLEVYRGSTYGRNAILGFLGGAVFSGGIAALIVSSSGCNGDLCGLRYMAIPYATLGGGLVGLFVGLGFAKQTWEPVSYP